VLCLQQAVGSRFDPALAECLTRVLQELGELPSQTEWGRAQTWAAPALGGREG